MRLKLTLTFFTAMLPTVVAQAAPIPYVGGNYSQNFNGLPTTGSTTLADPGPHDIENVLGGTGVVGWTMVDNGGTAAGTEYRAQDGSLSGSGGRGIVSYGTTGSTDRALGTLPTSAQIGRFGVSFTNNTGSTLNQFTLSFIGEQWRRGDIATGDTFTFEYVVGTADINAGGFQSLGSFASPNLQGAPNTNVALDGNFAANQTPVLASVNNANWTVGSVLTVRWNAADISGQDDGLAIDNLGFAASVPEPASFVMMIIFSAIAAGFLRRR